MCGIFLSDSHRLTMAGLQVLKHRGRDSSKIIRMGPWYLGFNRLAIVDVRAQSADQPFWPFDQNDGVVAFNGEIYNQAELAHSLESTGHHKSEAMLIDQLMRRYPANFERFLDGYYAIVRLCSGNQTITLSRDLIGVMPLYYQKRPFRVSSEAKALGKPVEVMPGETLTFDFNGKLKKRRRFDPWSLHMEPMDMSHLEFLFTRAVARRVSHSERNIAIALSGGLDSALVLAALHRLGYSHDVQAITVSIDNRSDEVDLAQMLCRKYGVVHKVVHIDKKTVEQHWHRILYHLEDPHDNPIKRGAMIRNYFTAMHAPGTVILCGEGADELGGGYPSHAGLKGLALEWKCLSTLRSMHAINLDRVNKGGMAYTREFRTPFLDRALVLYCMSCEKEPDKYYFRELARQWNVPEVVVSRAKYSEEEETLRALPKALV